MLKDTVRKLDSISNKEELWDYFGEFEYDYEATISSDNQRLNGIYYTHKDLASHMISELVSKLDKKNLVNYTFFEPCVGLGAFVFAYLYELSNLNLSKEDYIKILKNIYASDSNMDSIILYKVFFKKFAKILFDIDTDREDIELNVSSALIFNLNSEKIDYISLDKYFPQITQNGGFDIIITNPPYKNLKAERNKYKSTVEFERDKKIFSQISSFTKSYYKYVNTGTLNIFKLFVEEILCNYSKPNAVISLLIPNAILTDKSCEKIRRYILDNHNLSHINIIKEGAGYINAQQSLASLLIVKNERTKNIKINNSFKESNKKNYSIVSKNDLSLEKTGYSIFTLNQEEYSILNQLREFPTIKDLDFIINMRGELDLTLNKKSIVTMKTRYRLLRGRDLSYYSIQGIKPFEFVDENFILSTSKAKYINMPRITCQQIANMSKERRLTFSLIPPRTVLANSCNFMVVNPNKFNLDLYALLGIMNSRVLNWMFKITSSNNHINNYELDMLPIPLQPNNLRVISELVQEYLESNNKDLLLEIDQLVDKSFNISFESNKEMNKHNQSISSELYSALKSLQLDIKPDIKVIQKVIMKELDPEVLINSLNLEKGSFLEEVASNLVLKYLKISNGEIFNHTTFKLSDLDLEMVKSVPQGGNWKNIPTKTILKSKRLIRISETGGRTTLYGRIDYNKPSYTITTYFNRPGNGTYIHPIHDRVLSAREAARFQSFPDDYLFVGNKTNVLKQIGNAVPTMLAFSIGRNLVKHLNCRTSIDLFCGAGGLTVGLHEAGITSIVGIDNDKRACITLKVNNPGMHVICDDITKKEVKEELYSKINFNDVDLVCGGPPCQGFSHAGKRFIDDPRNKLFKDFVEIVEKVNPKIMILENVPGMLTLSKGLIYKQIINLFKEKGYVVEGRLLLASDYCVPQKRKRLIIIGVREDIGISPSKLFPEKITSLNPISSKEAIGDLENIECSENSKNVKKKNLSKYAKMLKREISFEDFYSSYTEKPILEEDFNIEESSTQLKFI